jgi:hypothetical protein
MYVFVANLTLHINLLLGQIWKYLCIDYFFKIILYCLLLNFNLKSDWPFMIVTIYVFKLMLVSCGMPDDFIAPCKTYSLRLVEFYTTRRYYIMYIRAYIRASLLESRIRHAICMCRN